MPTYLRAPEPGGPILTGAELRVLTKNKDGQDFSMVFFPDVNNDLLRQSGKPMHFYYLPDRSFLARETRNGKEQYKFHLQEFAGILTKDGNVATPKDFEIAGGYLTLTTTMAYDEQQISQITDNLQKELEKSYQGATLFEWKKNMPRVKIGPVQITKCITVLDKMDLNVNLENISGPQPGAFVVQGEGAANLSATGTNAYSVLLGALPVQMLRASTMSAQSSLIVRNHLSYKILTPKFTLRIKGNWQSIYHHLSASFKGRSVFVSADLNAEWNKMMKTGVIQVEMQIDKEFFNETQEAALNTYKEAIVNKFTDLAKTAILDPATPQVEPAKAQDRGKWLWGGGAAFKFRKDISTLDLEYEETLEMTILKETSISTNLQGLADEIKKDRNSEKIYFSRVYLDEGFQKIHVIASCNANFGSNGQPGDPIDRIDVQFGYPDSKGKLVWKPTGKFKSSNADAAFSEDSAPIFWDATTAQRLYVVDYLKQKQLANPNAIYVRKNIRYKAQPNVLVKTISVEQVTEDRIIEVRGEPAGKFGVKISLDNVPLPPKTKVIVTCRVDGLPDEMFEFNTTNTSDIAPIHNWEIYYAKPEDIKPWKYKVDVQVAGPRFGLKTLKWSGDWQNGSGIGRSILLDVSIPDVPAALEPILEQYLSGLSPKV